MPLVSPPMHPPQHAKGGAPRPWFHYMKPAAPSVIMGFPSLLARSRRHLARSADHDADDDR